MKNMATISFISSASKCLLVGLFVFISYQLTAASNQKKQNHTELLKPIASAIDLFSRHTQRLAPEKLNLLPHTSVYQYVDHHLPKRIFKYKLPSQNLKILYKKNRVAIIYNNPNYLPRKQADQRSGYHIFDVIPGKTIWQLLRQNELSFSPIFFQRMQRGDFSTSDDPLINRLLS